MAIACDLLGKGKLRFCFECAEYPCERLKSLDKRYRTKYHMSMIENLIAIRDTGMDDFLKAQEEKWRCPTCGGTICCEVRLWLSCELNTFLQNKKSQQ